MYHFKDRCRTFMKSTFEPAKVDQTSGRCSYLHVPTYLDMYIDVPSLSGYSSRHLFEDPTFEVPTSIAM